VGLWFSVQNPKNDDVDGQFWIYSVPHDIHLNEERYGKLDICNLKQTYFINVPIYWSEEYLDHVAEVKRARQHGKFTISGYDDCIIPFEDQKSISPYLEKYCIPAASKADIRLQLTGLGILTIGCIMVNQLTNME